MNNYIQSYDEILLEKYIEEIYEGFNFEPFKKIVKNLGKELITNFKFIGTFGAAITLFYPIVENILKNSNVSVEINSTNIVLATIAAISMILDHNSNKIDWALKNLKDMRWKEIIENLSKAFLNIKELLNMPIKSDHKNKT